MLNILFNLRRSGVEKPQTGGLFRAPFRQHAGMLVNQDNAIKYSAVFACVRAIAEPIAMLPWRVHRRLGNGGNTIVNTSPVDRLLHSRPNTEMSAMSFRQTLIAWALLWGNGYAEIERDVVGRPIALWPISPDRVEPMRDLEGNLIYKIFSTGDPAFIPANDMFHLSGLGFDGLTGYSILSLAARSIGLGLAAEQFGASFFGNNTVIGGVLEHPAGLSDKAYDRIKTSWNEDHLGPGRSHKPQILEEGMKWHSLAVPPNDSQFLETRQHQVEDIARWFGVKPHKIGLLDRSIKANIESQNIEMVVDTLQPWVVRIEQEADAKLFSRRNASGLFSKINLNSLLRGDSKARSEFYKTMAALGAFSVNDIIELEDGNPIGPLGDKRIVPMNMTTLDRIGEEPQPTQALPDNDDVDDDKLGEDDVDIDPETDESEISDGLFPFARPFMQDAIVRALSYESRDYQKSLNDHQTIDSLVTWSNAYFQKHRPSILNKLSPITQSMALLSDVDEHDRTNVFNRLVNDYVDWHIEQSKRDFNDMFNENLEMKSFETQIEHRVSKFYSLIQSTLDTYRSSTHEQENH